MVKGSELSLPIPYFQTKNTAIRVDKMRRSAPVGGVFLAFIGDDEIRNAEGVNVIGLRVRIRPGGGWSE